MTKVEKSIALYDEREVAAFENAINAVQEEHDDDLRQGEVVRELSAAYTGWDGEESQDNGN